MLFEVAILNQRSAEVAGWRVAAATPDDAVAMALRGAALFNPDADALVVYRCTPIGIPAESPPDPADPGVR